MGFFKGLVKAAANTVLLPVSAVRDHFDLDDGLDYNRTQERVRKIKKNMREVEESLE